MLAKTMPLSGRAGLPPNVRRLPLGTIAHKTSSREEFPLSQPNREHEIERANLPHCNELWSRLTKGPKPHIATPGLDSASARKEIARMAGRQSGSMTFVDGTPLYTPMVLLPQVSRLGQEKFV